MLILIGASASGKTEIAKLLIKEYGFEKLVTTTTRPMRVGEVDNVDYNFVTPEEFYELKDKDAFFEWVIYNDNCYGTPKKSKENNVLIVDPIGANNIFKNSEGHMFILLETDEDIRKNRMLKRGDLKEDVESRILHDRKHFKREHLIHIDYDIDTSNETIEDLAKTINGLYNS